MHLCLHDCTTLIYCRGDKYLSASLNRLIKDVLREILHPVEKRSLFFFVRGDLLLSLSVLPIFHKICFLGIYVLRMDGEKTLRKITVAKYAKEFCGSSFYLNHVPKLLSTVFWDKL